jgi:hypothetical protein
MSTTRLQMTDRRGVEAAMSVRSKRLLEIWLGGEERLRLVREAREIREERRNVSRGSAAAPGKNSANSASEDNSSSSACDTSGADTDEEEEVGLSFLTSQVLVLAKVRSLKHHCRTRRDLNRSGGGRAFVYNWLMGLPDDHFFRDSRMTSASYELLVAIISPWYEARRTCRTPGPKPTPPRQQLFHCVKLMAYGITTWLSTSNDRGVARSTLELNWVPGL